MKSGAVGIKSKVTHAVIAQFVALLRAAEAFVYFDSMASRKWATCSRVAT